MIENEQKIAKLLYFLTVVAFGNKRALFANFQLFTLHKMCMQDLTGTSEVLLDRRNVFRRRDLPRN